MRPPLGGYSANSSVFRLSDSDIEEINEYVRYPEGVVEKVDECCTLFLGSVAIERQRPRESGTRENPGVKDHLKSIEKAAGKLACLIEDINNPQDPEGFSTFDLLAGADPETVANSSRKLKEIAELQLTRLSRLGRSGIGEIQQFLVWQLRKIYLDAGGEKHKVTYDPIEDTYNGPFFKFVWVIFNSLLREEYTPDMKVTNSSVGKIISRALKDET